MPKQPTMKKKNTIPRIFRIPYKRTNTRSMPRIRTIKPEFWNDESIGTLSHGARLLFLGCLNLADDEGLLRWNEMFLSSAIFPYDDIKGETVAKWMNELHKADLVYLYHSNLSNQKLAWIVNFLKHQRVDKPQPSKFTPPPVSDNRVKMVYYRRDGGICQICGGRIDLEAKTKVCGSKALSLDHIKHLVRGGNDYPSNMRAVHLGCNKSRSLRPDEELDGEYQKRHRMGPFQEYSTNDSENDSTPEGNGKGMEIEGRGEIVQPPPKEKKSNAERAWENVGCNFDAKTKDLWVTMCNLKKWKGKEVGTLEMSLNKLMRYEQPFSVGLIENAIAGEYQGVVFADTDDKYKKWLNSKNQTGTVQATLPTASDIVEQRRKEALKRQQQYNKNNNV